MNFETYYEKTYKKYRREFFKIVNELEEDTGEILNDTNNQVDQIFLSNISDENSLRLSVQNLLRTTISLWTGRLILQNTRAVSKTRDYALELTNPYNSPVLRTQIEFNYQEILNSSYGNRLLNRKFPTTNITLGENIKTIEGNALKTTQRILQVGFNEGKDAKQIASEIKNFIKKDERKKWVSPFEWYRQANGYKLNQQPILDRIGGSLDYQTMRIARTEINYSWRHSTINIHENTTYLKGWEWRLSRSHEKPDICDDWARNSPYKKEDIPQGHPNCLCAVIPVVIPPDQL